LVVDEMKKSLFVLISCLIPASFACRTNAVEGYWMSPPLSGYGHVITDPKDNFLNPDVKTDYTSTIDGVTAMMTVINSAFTTDGCRTAQSKCAATLKIFKKNVLLMTKNYSGFQYLSGPSLAANLRGTPPTVTVDVVDPREEYHNYNFVKKTGKYNETIDGPEPAVDENRAEPPIFAVRVASHGDVSAEMKWNAMWGNLNNGGKSFDLKIKQGANVVWSGALPLEVPSRDSERSIEAFGPIVLPLDDVKRECVLARFSVPIKENGVENLTTVDFVFYSDGGKEFRSFKQTWNGTPPHLADHDRDGKVEFITQDYEFAKKLWLAKDSPLKSGTGGPMQIWRWNKNRFDNVTKQLPNELKRHAASSLKQFKSEPDHPECYLLGYVGDLCLLGEKKNALNVLDQMATPNTVKMKSEIIEQLTANGYFLLDRASRSRIE